MFNRKLRMPLWARLGCSLIGGIAFSALTLGMLYAMLNATDVVPIESRFYAELAAAKLMGPMVACFGAGLVFLLLSMDENTPVERSVKIRSGRSAPPDKKDVLVWVRYGREDEYRWQIAACYPFDDPDLSSGTGRCWLSIQGTLLVDSETGLAGEPRWYCDLPEPR